MDQLLGSKLLTKVGGPTKATDELLKDKDLVLLYFSASWCPPCKAFSPLLVEFYNAHAKTTKLEVIYISSDRTIPSFEDYYKSMPWLAVPFEPGSAAIKQNLAAVFGIQGIPMLIVIDAKTGEFITANAREEVTRVSGKTAGVAAADSPANKLIAQWKQQERKPLSEATSGAGGNIIFDILKWFMKNPMSIFALLYLYRYVKKMYSTSGAIEEEYEPDTSVPVRDQEDSEF
jgi:nucleoredoxin